MSTHAFGSMQWFIGVIEDINDPLGVNRVRVRAVNFHSPDRSILPVSDLPWATIVNTGSNMSAPMFNQGDWVVGFFLDGSFAQQPVVFGSLDGIPASKVPSQGFSDPAGVYPKELNKPTTSSVARGDLSSPSNPINYIKNSVTKSVETSAGSNWSEPTPSYAAKYPNDHVFQTSGSNIVELDDTEGSERIHIFHRSGSLVEFAPDGSVTNRILGTGFSIVMNGQNVAIHGNYNVTVDGDINFLSSGNMNLSAKNINLSASDSISVTAKNQLSEYAKEMMMTGEEMLSTSSSGIVASDGSSMAIQSGQSVPANPGDVPSAPKISVVPKYNPPS